MRRGGPICRRKTCWRGRSSAGCSDVTARRRVGRSLALARAIRRRERTCSSRSGRLIAERARCRHEGPAVPTNGAGGALSSGRPPKIAGSSAGGSMAPKRGNSGVPVTEEVRRAAARAPFQNGTAVIKHTRSRERKIPLAGTRYRVARRRDKARMHFGLRWRRGRVDRRDHSAL